MTEQPHSKREIETGRKLFLGECTFMLSVVSLKTMPDADLPEIAFAGRSNVGKSSIINKLTNRKTLAKTSNTPGRTQQINFFDLGGQMHIVDLPGYGYAKASKKDVKSWNSLIRQYLKGRPTLRRVCLLIDSRHGVKANDIEIMDLLDDSAVNYQVVLTKTDKIKKAALEKCIAETQEILKKHAAAFPVVRATSSAKGTGIDALRADLAILCAG